MSVSPAMLSGATRSANDSDDDEDALKNLLNLKLKKPARWNWELTTSKSSSSINFPRIRLYDHHNNLLAEADESEQLINNTTSPQTPPSHHAATPNKQQIKRKKAESFATCATATNHDDRNSTAQHERSASRSKSRSKTMDMSTFLDGIRNEMLGQGIECKVRQRSSCERGRSGSRKRHSSEKMRQSSESMRDDDLRGEADIQEEDHIHVTLPRPPLVTGPTTGSSPTSTSNLSPGLSVKRHSHQRDHRQETRTNLNAPIDSEPTILQPDPIHVKHVLGMTTTNKCAGHLKPNVVPLAGSYTMTKSKSALDVPGGRAVKGGGWFGGGAQGTTGKKKVYRRTHSTNSSLRFSSSILERFSETKRRSSSTDSEKSKGAIVEEPIDQSVEERIDEVGYKPPNYILRTCPAGTLIVCKDSFHSKCGRRRNASAPRRVTHPESEMATAKNHSPSNNSYDTAIANIDTLISRAISGTRRAKDSAHDSKRKKNGASGSAAQHKVVQLPASSSAIRDQLTARSRSVSSVPNASGGGHNLGAVVSAVDGRSAAAEYGEEGGTRRSGRGRKRSDWDELQRQRQSIVGGGEKNCKFRGRHRSASVGSVREEAGGSSSDDGGHMKRPQQANRRARERTRRPKITSDQQEPMKTLLAGSSIKADPQRSLKHSLSLTGLETTDDHLFGSSSEKQVLLDLVQRLASLQQQQQPPPQAKFPVPPPTVDRLKINSSPNHHSNNKNNHNKNNSNRTEPLVSAGCHQPIIKDPYGASELLINASPSDRIQHHHQLHQRVNNDWDINKKSSTKPVVCCCKPTISRKGNDCDAPSASPEVNNDDDDNNNNAFECRCHGSPANARLDVRHQEHQKSAVGVVENVHGIREEESTGDGLVVEEKGEAEEERDAGANMGSNVSRHSGKGLSGRRTQSSGDLCSDPQHHQDRTGLDAARNQTNGASFCATKHKRRIVTQANGKSGAATAPGDQSTNTTTIGTDKAAAIYGRINVAGVEVVESGGGAAPPPTTMMMMAAPSGGGRVSRGDRNKFSGSLPNHLDVGLDGEMMTNGATGDHQAAAGESAHHHNNNNIEYVTVGGQYLPHHHHHLHHHHPSHQQQQQQQQQPGQSGYTTYPAGNQQQQPPGSSSPYNNSSSEKESTSSSSNLGSTFRSNNDCNKPDIQLRLPIHRTAFDPGCDQGYGSERSPEDELPPPLPNLQMAYPLEAAALGICSGPKAMPPKAVYEFSFITPDCCFPVQITKGPRGLGLSVSGGTDSNSAFPGLIRIKRLFPHQVAWSTGMLQQGDILLAANGIPLTGLTNYEALEVLRTMPDIVNLTVCRPRDEQYRKLSPPAEAPKPPQRNQPSSLPLYPIQMNFCGEFEIIMVKQQGSLGFTLRKEDESVLGHCVRALVREPATTDGRIQPGDKIVAVNDVEMCQMSHEEAVIFLRMAAETVKLRLYREEIQTPVGLANEDSKSLANAKNKTLLRPEAMHLLNDLACRNKKNHTTSTTDTDLSGASIRSTNTTPRRLKRNGGNKSGGNTSTSDEGEKTDSKSFSYPNYIVTSQPTSVCSDSEASITSQCSYVVQPAEPLGHSTFAIAENDADFYDDDELWKQEDGDEAPYRPAHLLLAGESGSTPVSSRKPRFQFTVAANAYELNNLDNDALDAPIFTLVSGCSGSGGGGGVHQHNINAAALDRVTAQSDFASLPCETFLVACKTNESQERERRPVGDEFAGRNHPVYQSAHAQTGNGAAAAAMGRMMVDDGGGVDCVDHGGRRDGGTTSLLKWKGVMFASDDDEEEADGPIVEDASSAAGDKAAFEYVKKMDSNRSTGSRGKNVAFVIDAEDRNGDGTTEENSSISSSGALGTRATVADGFDLSAFASDGHKVYNVELHRGWNSRLGFSLQTGNTNAAASDHGTMGGSTVISAIYSDSVAAKDGRLKVGDQVLMVNDEPVVRMSTNEVIDLLRIIRGSIVLTIRRAVSA